jgi:hypothetical protein
MTFSGMEPFPPKKILNEMKLMLRLCRTQQQRNIIELEQINMSMFI